MEYFCARQPFIAILALTAGKEEIEYSNWAKPVYRTKAQEFRAFFWEGGTRSLRMNIVCVLQRPKCLHHKALVIAMRGKHINFVRDYACGY